MGSYLVRTTLSSLAVVAAVALLCATIQSGRNFANTDLLIYQAATRLFFEGANPYDPAQIEQAERALGRHAQAPLQVWNPPTLYLLLGPVLLLSAPLLSVLWGALSGAAAWLLGAMGALLESRSNIRHLWWTLPLVLISCPAFLAELAILQISSVITCLLMIGAVSHMLGYHFLSGLLLSAAILKPHLFLLPLLVMCVWSMRSKRYGFFAGGALGAAAGLLLCEALNEGIVSAWIMRGDWPRSYLGSSVLSLLSAASSASGIALPRNLLLALPLLAIGTYLVWRWPRLEERSNGELMLAVAFNPLVTPYGYVFDQVTALPVIMYTISSAFSVSEYWGHRVLWMAVATGPVTYLLNDVEIGSVPLSWSAYSLMVLALHLWWRGRRDLLR